MMRMLLLSLLALAGALGAGTVRAAEPDVPGSRDPYGVERFPRSWIVEYRREAEARPREVVLGRVDRIRREMRVDDQLRLEGALETVTYRIPPGASVDDVVAHYRRELGDDLLFRCQGRDCGRSNDWANQIFEQAILYGPDRNQRYSVREWQGKLVALYVIRRGNQRVYAHLRFVEPEGGNGVQPNVLLSRRLAERGWVVVDAVTPDTQGGFDDAAAGVLGGLAAELGRFAGRELYVVCHLYGRGGAQALLAASERCAERGVALIGGGADQEAAGAAGVPILRPFGAGPLLPRGNAGARLELVLPGVVGAAPFR